MDVVFWEVASGKPTVILGAVRKLPQKGFSPDTISHRTAMGGTQACMRNTVRWGSADCSGIDNLPLFCASTFELWDAVLY